MNYLENLSSKEMNRLNGRIFYHDRNLYSQIRNNLLELVSLKSMLEETEDEVIRTYLLTKKGEVINELLRANQQWDYPDYPEVEEEVVEEWIYY